MEVRALRLNGLRQAREARGMSQVAFARRLGISRPTLIKAEQGGEISDSTARVIALGLELIPVVPAPAAQLAEVAV